MRGRGARALAVAAVLAACWSGAACSSSDDGDARPTTTNPTARPTATAPSTPRFTARVSREQELNPGYRQGLARDADRWVFTAEGGIFTAGDDLHETSKLQDPIPADLEAQGYDHVGDGDIAERDQGRSGGLLWVPLEKEDKDEGHQRIARYRLDPIRYIDSFEVPQHHAAFVAVQDDVIYSADGFTDDAITRYRLDGDRLVALAPLRMSRTVERIQGGDAADGALWLSTDDDGNGVYRVDLATGDVQRVGATGHVEGEGEGIDATDLDGALLHVVHADEQAVPMYLTDLTVTETPG